MLSRRTRARLDLLTSLFALVTALFVGRHLSGTDTDRDYRSQPDVSTPVLPRCVLVPRGKTMNSDDNPYDCQYDEDPGAIDDGADGERRRIRLRWTLAGAVAAVGYRWLLDRDVGSLRRSWSRRLVVGNLPALGNAAISRRDRDASYSFGVGSLAGAVAYRTVFGLVLEPPGPGLEDGST